MIETFIYMKHSPIWELEIEIFDLSWIIQYIWANQISRQKWVELTSFENVGVCIVEL